MLQIRLFGTVHIEGEDLAKEDLDAFAEGVDALFIEEPESREMTLPKLLLRNPGTFLGAIVYLLIKLPIQVIRNNAKEGLERSIADSYSAENNVPVYPVDVNRDQAMADVKWRITVLSWPSAIIACFTAVLAGESLTRLMFPEFALFLSLTLIFALLPFHFTVKSLDETRNQHMLDLTISISEREGYEDVCLITGDDHREPISELAEERGIEVTDERDRNTTNAVVGMSPSN